MDFSEINWAAVITGFGGAAAGLSAAAYQFKRTMQEDQEKARLAEKDERRNDHTVDFAEKAYKAIIQDYAEQVARKNEELMKRDLEIARLKLLADKDDERKDNMVRRHYTGKDILQTDIGVPK